MDDDTGLLQRDAVSAGTLCLVGLLSLPSWYHSWTRAARARRRRGAHGDGDGAHEEVVPPLFASADGEATAESVAAFSDRRPRLAASASLFLGLAAALAAAVLQTLRADDGTRGAGRLVLFLDRWADAVAWALLAVLGPSIPARAQYDRRFRLANLACLASAVLLVSLGCRYGADIVYTLSGKTVADDGGRAVAAAACWLLEMAAAAATAAAFAAFPHRPDVYYRGRLVDQQHAVSLLSRFSFDWNHVVFAIANARKLELDDLPSLDGDTRSSAVTARYLARGGGSGGPRGRLWWQLIVAYQRPLLLQWALTFVRSVLALFPQYVLYEFLEGLEHHDGGSKAANPRLWGWVLGIGLSLVLQIWVGSAQRWLTSSRLEAPLNSLVQSLIFQKALRLDEAADPGYQPADENDEPPAAGPDKKSGGAKKDTKAGGDVRQSVVNHMKLDSGRMMIFCTYNYWFPLALFKLVLAGTALAKLLGWRAFLAGFSCALVVYPVSHVLSKKYAKIQFGLMKYRDAKAHVLTEALQGMRQIKYSALEQLFERKILQSRNEELRQFWRVAKWMCSLTLIINTGPILLSCVSLAVYTFTTPTHVRASVIFASLGLFDQLDEAIGYLPIIQVYLMEAWTSCVRVEKYLNQPDKAPVADAGDEIVFRDATVRWPRVEDAEEPSSPVGPAAPVPHEGNGAAVAAVAAVAADETRSILRDVSLAFPRGELSLITGKTGAGKSLLLAAILGEVKLLSGTVRVPEAPPASVIASKDVGDRNWVLPTLTAFVSQTPWVESGSLKDNVLFGLPLRAARYRKVLQACALEKDIELLADGDETEVGPKGVTLSGGQRWRVALARALYSRAGILVLDDVLSAVDAHVGRTIVNEALTGALARGRTRILATHHPEMCLAHAAYLVRLDSGRVAAAEAIGGPSSLAVEEAVEEAVAEAVEEAVLEEGEGGSADEASHASGEEDGAPARPARKKADDEDRETGRVKSRVYRAYIRASNSVALWVAILVFLVVGRLLGVATTWSLKELSASHEGSEQPGAATGRSDRLLTQASLPDWDWPVHATTAPAAAWNTADGEEAAYRKNVVFWISAYVVFDLATLFVSVAQQLLVMFTGLRASRALFAKMTHAILRAPLRWIDTIPTGRVLNRFTSDTFTVDRRLASDLSAFLQSGIGLVVIIVASISVSPFIVVFGVGLLVLYGRIASVYIAAAREAKRINSVAHSPVYDQFSSVLTGLSTIRAFRRTGFYMDRMHGLIDDAAKASWAQQLLARWMNFRMGMFGALFVTTVAACIVFGDVEASLAGFGLVFALRYTSSLSRLLAYVTSIELGFNAAERMLEYMEIETEPEGGADAPAAWPSEGHIEVQDLTVGYAPGLPAVLKQLTFAVRPGERIGVVGRTGAGKSTLAAVLFRLLEPQAGSVRIDGIDIATLKLDQLRSRLAIIPQDPFLFSGTLRSNLDLEGALSDEELHQVLRRVHLVGAGEGVGEGEESEEGEEEPTVGRSPVEAHSEEEVVGLLDGEGGAAGAAASEPGTPAALASESATEVGSAAPESSPSTAAGSEHGVQGGSGEGSGAGSGTDVSPDEAHSFTNLAMPVSTGGGNLSQGQRQLVCLARALLTRPKIVVLDEATSAVDRGTDGAIQASLRREFAAGGCTVLVIAHRLSTVVDFDRVLVLQEGRVAEMGTPRELMERGMARDRQAEAGVEAGVEAGDAGDEAAGEAVGETGGETVGVFWELVKKSAEKDKLVEMVFGA